MITNFLRLLILSLTLSSSTAAEESSIKVTVERGFHVVTIDPSSYPKETAVFELTFNGFLWGYYKVGKPIMLVKVSGLPNSVVLVPLNRKAKRLNMRTEFTL